MAAETPVAVVICRAVTADHPTPTVVAAVHRQGGYPDGHSVRAVHLHSDAPPQVCDVVYGVPEAIPARWPHRADDGTELADHDQYLAHLARYAP